MPAKILVLDDDDEIIALLKRGLKDAPFEVVYATSGVEAATKIFEAYQQQRPFDALIMDCALPRLDGFTIGKMVRLAEEGGVSKRARIAYFTAYGNTVDQSSLLREVGAEAYWRKPEDTQHLPALIRIWLQD